LFQLLFIIINCTNENYDLYLCQFTSTACKDCKRTKCLKNLYLSIMKDRILKVMEQEGMTPSKFAESIGIQRSAMSHIISGRNNPSLDVLLKILEKFTYIQSDWLLFGKGNMRKDEVYTEPDLFPMTAVNQPGVPGFSENRRENEVQPAVNISKHAVIEKLIPVEGPSKKVSKIMIFYSDNTYDTFIPEKSGKE